MDCSACGLANPPEAFVCRCGQDLAAHQPIEKPSEEINLAWRQMLAAYWSISWPSMIALPVILDLLQIPQGDVVGSVPNLRIFLLWQLVFFGGQAILIPRLVRKNHSSWNLRVVRENNRHSRRLSFPEASRIAAWIVIPQLLFLLFWTFMFRQLLDTAMRVSTLLDLLVFLVVGPFSVGIALRVKHRGFRLQAHGYRVGTLQ
jgi:hypothetical protein